MLLLRARSVLSRSWTNSSRTWLQAHGTHSHAFEPLRILYCGSDEFSSYVLQRLHKEKCNDHSIISSIDVVTKQGKRAGRGLKTIRQTPCTKMAHELGLHHHEIPTFTGWSPPPSNLVIAVSFGLLVPPRILSGAQYGGLNLHPSLLPDLWGPAPLHHVLLEGRKSSGVTLQTLHPNHFDRGRILAARPFDIPNNGAVTFAELRDTSMQIGADLLMDSLRQGLFLSLTSGEANEAPAQHSSGQKLTHARKVTSADAHVDWHTWSATRVLRTMNALGTVWSKMDVAKRNSKAQMRVIWKELSLFEEASELMTSQMNIGSLYGIRHPSRNQMITVVKAADGGILWVRALGLEGHSANTSMHDAARLLGQQSLS